MHLVILHVSTSPLTNTIYCGSVLKDGITWGGDKTDVTGEACAAVARHVLANNGPVTVSANGKPLYEISVVKVIPVDYEFCDGSDD